MVGHHDAGVNIGPSPAALLLAEKEVLVGSIVRLLPGGGRGEHATTVVAVATFLTEFSGDGAIPWLRMYRSFPAWQQQSELLNGQCGRGTFPQVFFTLLTPLGEGSGFDRKALGGGSWRSTGAVKTIGNGEVVLTKLYYKKDDRSRGGFTAFEFHLSADWPLHGQPRVALCVLHPTDYRHCARDLTNYAKRRWFPEMRNQANRHMVQSSATFYLDPYVDGARFMNGPHVDYTNNLASNSGTNIPGANQVDQMAVQHEGQYLAPHVGFTNGLHPDYTHNLDSNPEGWFMGGSQANLPMDQPSEPIYQDPYVADAGFMNGPHADYTSNLASNSGRNILGTNHVDQMAVQHEGQYLDSHAGFMNGLHVDYTINNTEGCFMGGNQANLVMEQSSEPIYPGPSVAGSGLMNGPHVDYTNNLASNSGSSGYYPPAGIQMDVPSNTCLMNDDMSYMPSEINMFGGQYSHANTMSIPRDYCNTSFWNSNMHAPIQDATTSYSQPSIHSSAALDQPFVQLLLSEYNSVPEPGGQNSHADGASAQNYYYNPC